MPFSSCYRLREFHHDDTTDTTLGIDRYFVVFVVPSWFILLDC
jgi:hypothetical protein